MLLFNKVKNCMRYAKLKKKNVDISSSATVNNTEFDGYNYVRGKSILVDCYIGRGTYIRDNCTFVKTKMGKYCSIAPRVRLICGNHPIEKNVALHPAFYTGKNIAGLPFSHVMNYEEYKFSKDGKSYCEIGHDVWIGSDTIILGGVTIGNGAVVAAGSVVTKDVEPYSIVAGVPAKTLKTRFSKEQIAFLEELKWWDKDDEWIRNNIKLFDNIEVLMKVIK